MVSRSVFPMASIGLSVWPFILTSLILRLAAAVYWHQLASPESLYFRLPDSHGYWVLADQIASGGPYQYGTSNAQVFRTPLYPLLLAPLTWIPDQYWAVLAARCLGAVLGTLAVFLMSQLARRLGGPMAGIAAGWISAIYPSAIGMSVIILSEALFVPLMIGQLSLWHYAIKRNATASRELDESNPMRRRQFLSSLASGCVAGLACLTRPSWLLFTPCLAVIFVLQGRMCEGRYRIVALALIGILVTMAPWWIRNAIITEKLVLTTLQVGPSLMDGLRPQASGASDSGMQFMTEIIQQQQKLDQKNTLALESTFEWRVNRLATQTALAWASQHPAQACKLAYTKLKRTWSLWPDGKELASNSMRFTVSFGCIVVMLLAIVGSVRLWSRCRLTLAMIWLPCLYFTALHLVFVGSIRYREPGVFALIVLAGLVTSSQLYRLQKTAGQFQSDKASPSKNLEFDLRLEQSPEARQS